MELVKGRRLTDLIPQDDVPIVGLLEWAERLCDAVAAAHQQGITYRDLKPDNIMINGEFDFFFPVDTSQKPLCDLLGAPEEHKKYVVFPGSHSIPRSEMLGEVLGWLDQYQ